MNPEFDSEENAYQVKLTLPELEALVAEVTRLPNHFTFEEKELLEHELKRAKGK